MVSSTATDRRDDPVGLFFSTVASQQGEYLVYDDGYRPRRYSYRATWRAPRGISRRGLANRASAQAIGSALERESAGMGGCLLGLRAARRRRRAHRRTAFGRVPAARRADHGAQGDPRRRRSDATATRPSDPRLAPLGSRLGIGGSNATSHGAPRRHLVQILFTSGRDGRAQGRCHHAPQHSGQHRARRAARC